MRTDVKINSRARVRLPAIPLASPGRKAFATRGDMVAWTWDGASFWGRVIGVVEGATDLALPHVCVAMLLLNGTAYERWVAAVDIYDCRSCRHEDADARWLFSQSFLESKPDDARRLMLDRQARRNKNEEPASV